jgi:hypothetical protein
VHGDQTSQGDAGGDIGPCPYSAPCLGPWSHTSGRRSVGSCAQPSARTQEPARPHRTRKLALIGGVAPLLALAAPAFAQDADALARQFNWDTGLGPDDDGGRVTLNVQPVPMNVGYSEETAPPYSTVTDLARLRGWSTSVPLSRAT